MAHLDPTDIHGQLEAEEALEERQRQLQTLEAEDFKWLMADKRGRRFVWRLLEQTGAYRNPFTGNSGTFFKCGEMAVGQNIHMMILQHSLPRYEQMITENAK